MDAVEQAQSGHPGTPMALAPGGLRAVGPVPALRSRRIPTGPTATASCSPAATPRCCIYGLLHLSGYDLSLEDIRQFRQWGSRTPGHPERGHTPGVETTTGPLGQGVGNAVGMAIAERFLAERFNRPGARRWSTTGSGGS